MASSRKSVNREVFEGADVLALRLRAAKKPAVIPFLEIPPEEIDIEPVTLDMVEVEDAEPMPISPLVVPMDEILPYDDEEPESDDASASTPPAQPAPPTGPKKGDGSKNLSLFGVGEIDNDPKRKRR